MPSRHRIQCINKSDRSNPHERVINVGGLNGDGTRWKVFQEDAITGIESGKWSFYVDRPAGHPVEVIVVMSTYGTRYLKTTADDDQPTNLLSLPECP